MTNDLENTITPLELKIWRLKNQMTQRDAACELCVTQLQYGRWERGEHPIPKYAEKIIRLLDELS